MVKERKAMVNEILPQFVSENKELDISHLTWSF
jgi:hypothetical protein